MTASVIFLSKKKTGDGGIFTFYNRKKQEDFQEDLNQVATKNAKNTPSFLFNSENHPFSPFSFSRVL